jgi:hypothetical protein
MAAQCRHFSTCHCSLPPDMSKALSPFIQLPISSPALRALPPSPSSAGRSPSPGTAPSFGAPCSNPLCFSLHGRLDAKPPWPLASMALSPLSSPSSTPAARDSLLLAPCTSRRGPNEQQPQPHAAAANLPCACTF